MKDKENKEIRTVVRMTAEDDNKLSYLTGRYGKDKSKVIRHLINSTYELLSVN